MALVGATSVAEALLALKIAFLVLLYLFVIRVIRSAGRERPAASQDSMILTPAAAAAAGLGPRPRRAVRLVVQRSPSLEEGEEFPLNSAPVTVGRGGQNDLVLTDDEFASARHARIESRPDGVWVQDLDSTNGTYVNGSRVMGAKLLLNGDVLRVGETDLRIEED